MKVLPNGYSFIMLVAGIGILGGFLFGYDTGIISGALPFITKVFHLSLLYQEIVVSNVVLGALFGAVISGFLTDMFGRKFILIITSMIFSFGTVITVFATNFSMLAVGRLIVGFAIGISSYAVPLFISEMAPAKCRGSLVLLNAITITGGEAIAFYINYIFLSDGQWRFMFAIGIIPAILFLLGMLFLPETPRWLISKGYLHKAQIVLSKIGAITSSDMNVKTFQTAHRLNECSYKNLFSKKSLPLLAVGIGLGVFQQFSGINTIMYYGPTVFKAVSFQSSSAQILATLIMGMVNTVMSIVAVLIVDYVGRRVLLLVGSATAAMSLGVLGLVLHHVISSNILQWISIISIIIYVAGYCISVGSLFWLIIAEIYPQNIRGMAMSTASAVQWTANFLVSMTFLNIIKTIGLGNTFLLYACMCIMCFLFVYYFVPETKGVSLEQIEKNIIENKQLRYLGLTAFKLKNKIFKII